MLQVPEGHAQVTRTTAAMGYSPCSISQTHKAAPDRCYWAGALANEQLRGCAITPQPQLSLCPWGRRSPAQPRAPSVRLILSSSSSFFPGWRWLCR